jgi:hypothetical protein
MQLTIVRFTATVSALSGRLPAIFHGGALGLTLACFSLAATAQAQSLPIALPAIPFDPLPGQPRVATVGSATGGVVHARRNKIVFQQIGVQPLQVVSIALQYPVALAGTIVAIEPLDGGRVGSNGQPFRVAADGTLNFTYEVGESPGLYQVRLHYDEEAIALQFWALDAAHPENNPSVLLLQ